MREERTSCSPACQLQSPTPSERPYLEEVYRCQLAKLPVRQEQRRRASSTPPPYVRGFTSLAVRKIVISNKLHDLRLDLGREEEAGRRRGRGIQLENDEDALNTFWLDTPSRYAPLEASLSLYEREESGRRVGGGRPGGVLSTRRLSSSRQLAPTLLLLQTAYSTMLSLQNKRKRLLISPSACIAPKIARRTSALLLQGRDTTGEIECGRLVTVDTDGVQGAFLVLLSFLEERSEMGAHSSGEDNSAGD